MLAGQQCTADPVMLTILEKEGLAPPPRPLATKFFHMQSPRVPLTQAPRPPPPASEKWAAEPSASPFLNQAAQAKMQIPEEEIQPFL